MWLVIVLGCGAETGPADTGGDTDAATGQPPPVPAATAVPEHLEVDCEEDHTIAVDIGGLNPNAAPVPRIDAWQATAGVTWIPAGTIVEIDDGIATLVGCTPGQGSANIVHVWIWR